MVGEIEDLIGEIRAIVKDIEATNRHVAAVIDDADAVAKRAESVVGDAIAITVALTPVVTIYPPILAQLAPMITRFAQTTGVAEADVLVRLINSVPGWVDKLSRDIVPVLDTLDTVAPDVRHLLVVAKEVNEMLSAVPGFGRVRKRIDGRSA